MPKTYLRPLDDETFKAATEAMSRGRVLGISPIAALHSAGLLLSPDLAARIREEILMSAAETIRTARLRDLMPPRYLKYGASPSEMREAIVGRLEELAQLTRLGEFR